ncbi:MAG: xanthine dehydrogenase family protein subunit M, partial [Chloroflexi bacterium]
MDVFLPRTLDEALTLKAAHPEALPLAGGTDVLVDINFGRLRPAAIIDLTRLAELQTWSREDGHLVLGSGVPYARIVTELSGFIALVQASRSVGSPQ